MSCVRLLSVVCLFCVTGFAAEPEAYLSMKVTSGSHEETRVTQPTNCKVVLIAPEHLALAKAAVEGYVKFSEPGAMVPNIEYAVYYKGKTRTLESHSERGSAFNTTAAAQELQDLVFGACRE